MVIFLRRLIRLTPVFISLFCVEGFAQDRCEMAGQPLERIVLRSFHLNEQMPYRLADIHTPLDMPQKLNQAFDDRIAEFFTAHSSVFQGKHNYQDRYGQKFIHIFASQKTAWLQAMLISQGLSLVYPKSLGFNCINALYQLENKARQQKRGIWADEAKQKIQSATNPNLTDFKGTYQIIRGKILSIGETKSTLYLNFGTFWNEDFTVTIPQKLIKKFVQEEGQNSLAGKFLQINHMKGRKVEVRGWVLEHKGALIEILHPMQLRFEFQD